MNHKNLRFLFLIITLIICTNFVKADIFPQQQLTNYTLLFTADNATSCTLSNLQYSDNSISPALNLAMNQNGQTWSYVLTGNNFTKLGTTCMYYTCTNPLAFPTVASGNTCVIVTASGSIVSPVQVTIYVFFLLFCLVAIYFSVRLINADPYSKDNLTASQKYEVHRTDKFQFYLNLLKKKFWILGVFGIYLFLFLFTTILNGLVLNLGLGELNLLLIYFNDIMAWMSIPFVLFWFGYILLYFYKGTEEILRYQFGGFPRESEQ